MKQILLFLFFPVYIYGQSLQTAIKKQDYNQVIKIIQDSLKVNPNNARLYCELGHYYHYRAYDSRPLIGYNQNYSDSIINFLDRAIALKPDYRESYYWLHAEYGGRARNAILNNQIRKCKQEYQTAVNKGAMPNWLLEFGRNTLNSCDSSAILFTLGDLAINSIQCLQIIDHYRTDVTVIPIGYSGRTNFTKLYKYGIDNVVRPVKIRFMDDQIMEMRPYKWDTLDIKVKINTKIKQQYSLENDYLIWSLAPDIISEGSTFLSPWLALFAEIIEANQFERPIYFGVVGEKEFVGLYPYTINCGIVRKLVPFNTKGTEYEMDNKVFERVLLNKNNFKDFKDVEKNNFPGRSQFLLNYHVAFYNFSEYYSKRGMKNKTSQLKDFIRKNLSSEILKTDNYLNWIKD
jgi:hypothetical protein